MDALLHRWAPERFNQSLNPGNCSTLTLELRRTPKGVPYYELTPESCKEMGLPPDAGISEPDTWEPVMFLDNGILPNPSFCSCDLY